ncbi:MAG: hypothetical protein GX331_01370 [Firmicutes bacterium]|jgi:hypothetical protein|nr:hypothetical protein [Bacillota bacterium]
MQRRKFSLLTALILVFLVSGGVFAQAKGFPVDIPGTGVNFFLYRYEGEKVPYAEINAIWANLSSAFLHWVEAGQNPQDLSEKDVAVRTTADGQVGIFLKDQLIVIVDDYHAKINRATPKQLGEMWAANLKKGVERFVMINERRN